MDVDKALKHCKSKYQNLENVVAIGISEKNNQKVIVILVSKLTANIKKLPRKLEDIEIEIREVGSIKAQ